MADISDDIVLAKQLLDRGELVAIPTETVYGLAANGTSTEALEKIFKTKGRPVNNPLILHFKNLKSIHPFISEIHDDLERLALRFWPGPLTLLLPKSEKVVDIVTAGSSRVAVRVPSHPITLGLLNSLDYPLAAPSANPSGYISPTRPHHVKEQLGHKIQLILDGGVCTSGIESTILGWDGEEPVIYRKGVITSEEIEEVLGKVPKLNQKTKVLEAPGMLSSHYAPRTLTLAVPEIGEVLKVHQGKKIGLIMFKNSFSGKPVVDKEIVLSKEGSLKEMAQKLYAAMYELDALGLDVIIIQQAPEEGIGKAINDRLQRSSFHE